MNHRRVQREHRSVRQSSAQRDRRSEERQARTRALVFVRWALRRGISPETAAERLDLAPRTLAQWRQQWRSDRLDARLRGRPCRRADVATRNRIVAFLRAHGPGLGLPTLQAEFPGVARGELRNLQRRFRRVYQQRVQRLLRRLHWSQPGAVWAMDHVQPPQPVDGVDRQVLAVRDLASGYQLGWLPVAGATAQTTGAALAALFQQHGPPLVLQCDNGSAFTADVVEKLLDRWQVRALLSPPATPQYNGGCEASNGAMRRRTDEQAALAGRPGRWTDNDLRAALRVANEVHRPRRHSPIRAAIWNQRMHITEQQRDAFRDSVQRQLETARAEFAAAEERVMNHQAEARLQRTATTRALVEHGLLHFTSRHITPPLNSQKSAII